MTLSSNNFNKAIPTTSGTFAEDVPASGGSFASASPTSGGSFASNSSSSGGSFSADNPPTDNQVFDGDNTSAAAYGGDFGTFGDIYGQNNFGGVIHFKNRPTPPAIDH